MEIILNKSSSKKIAVCGSNEVISDSVNSISEQIGFEIGKRNGILLCGGMGGVMESASRGAKKMLTLQLMRLFFPINWEK